MSADTRCQLSFALAKMYEDFGDIDQSYSYLFEGNALRKKILKYSINQDRELFIKLKNTQPILLKNSLKTTENLITPTPIFILGMPRSGTTLVEQIISSHSGVTGGSELSFVEKYGRGLATNLESVTRLCISNFRKKYLSNLAKISKGENLLQIKCPKTLVYSINLRCFSRQNYSRRTKCSRNLLVKLQTVFYTKGLGYCYDLRDVVDYTAYTLVLWPSGNHNIAIEYTILKMKNLRLTKKTRQEPYKTPWPELGKCLTINTSKQTQCKYSFATAGQATSLSGKL